jgi:hypothetical protein
MNKRPVRFTTTGANAVVATALVFEILSVGAFSEAGYDVAACAGRLRSAAGGDCMDFGCGARRACPVGADHAHGPEQASFLMRAFLCAQAGG